MQATSYRIYGEVTGKIWMPAAECTKEFSWELERIPRDERYRTAYAHGWPAQITELRDILLHITNDGDFQSCAITWAVLEVTHWSASNKRNQYVTRVWELRGTGPNADCFAKA